MKNVTRYIWTMTGLAPSDDEYGVMRYVREIDYDILASELAKCQAYCKNMEEALSRYEETSKSNI